jgi:AcrR family transcriptional regulator
MPRLLPRAERRATLLAGAAEAFATGGFDGTSMDDIAAAGGVTKLIVYRHFESKEELYRAILEGVSGRLAERVAEALSSGRRQGMFGPIFLAVAREDPDGFRLLWVHSAREPKFAEYAAAVHAASVDMARTLLRDRVDAAILEWAAPMSVDFLVQAVLNWLETGEPGADDRFLEVVNRSLSALIQAWRR